MNKRNLNILLIGESGHGKSAFIRSLLDESGQFIDSTGDKQTTRTSMLYRINAKGEDRKIIITLRSRDSFCESRMARLLEGLDESDMDDLDNDEFENFRNKWVLRDKAFFHIDEFEKAKEMFNAYNVNICTPGEREMYESLAKTCNVSKSDNAEDLDDKGSAEAWENFLKEVYDLCFEEICEEAWRAQLIKNEDDKTRRIRITFDEDGKIQNADSDNAKSFLTKCFKVLNPDSDEKRESFSALVERIDVICPASDELKMIMEENDLDSLTMVDTYGINHKGDDVEEDELRERLILLMDEFSDETQEIIVDGFDYALYVNQLAQKKNDFASQLNRYVPALVAARSSIMSYVVLTGSDIPLQGEERTVDKYQTYLDNNSAYKMLHNRKSDLYIGTERDKLGIKGRLKKQKISNSIIESRIQAMVNYLTLYCANFDNVDEDKRFFLIKQNHEGLRRLLFAMTQRIHLGAAYISRRQMEDEGWKDILCVDGMLNSEQSDREKGDQLLGKKTIHHSIIYALGRRYSGDNEREKYIANNVIVGYYSPAIGPVGYLNPSADQSILRTPLANTFTSNFGKDKDDKPGFLDSQEQFSAICEVMNSHLDQLLCHEGKGIMKPAVCSRCAVQDTCLSYQIYLLSGLNKEEAWNGGYIDLRDRWKNYYLNMTEILKRATEDQKLKLQKCIMAWFEETIKDDILNIYNPARLAIILNAEKPENMNRKVLISKFDEYVKSVYGEDTKKEDRMEVLAIVQEKVLPKLQNDKWLDF